MNEKKFIQMTQKKQLQEDEYQESESELLLKKVVTAYRKSHNAVMAVNDTLGNECGQVFKKWKGETVDLMQGVGNNDAREQKVYDLLHDIVSYYIEMNSKRDKLRNMVETLQKLTNRKVTLYEFDRPADDKIYNPNFEEELIEEIFYIWDEFSDDGREGIEHFVQSRGKGIVSHVFDLSYLPAGFEERVSEFLNGRHVHYEFKPNVSLVITIERKEKGKKRTDFDLQGYEDDLLTSMGR